MLTFGNRNITKSCFQTTWKESCVEIFPLESSLEKVVSSPPLCKLIDVYCEAHFTEVGYNYHVLTSQ